MGRSCALNNRGTEQLLTKDKNRCAKWSLK